MLFIIFIILIKNKNIEYYKNISIDEYHKIMRDNNNLKIYKIGLNDNLTINREDCFEKCDNAECTKMLEMDRILKKCISCNSQKNKCFTKSIIGGTCDDCNENKDEKMNCYDIQNFGCLNPKDLNNKNGVEPYYIEINNKKKCAFCWNILDNI